MVASSECLCGRMVCLPGNDANQASIRTTCLRFDRQASASHPCLLIFFFFKQKTAYELTASDWSSDVCSSDLCLTAQPLENMAGAAYGFADMGPWQGSEERRVGKECSLLCRSRWSPYH